jgi:hypothetical protein
MYRVLEPYTLSTIRIISDAIWDENDDESMEERLLHKLIHHCSSNPIRNSIIKHQCDYFMDSMVSHDILSFSKYYQYYEYYE